MRLQERIPIAGISLSEVTSMRALQRVLVGMAIVAGVATGGVVAGDRAGSPQSGSDLALRPCTSEESDVPAECGRLSVFENRATRRGRRIEVHFMILRADRPGARQAVALFAGGPGQPSTIMAPRAEGWMRPVRATHDVLMVAQRGTGRSRPLDCDIHSDARPATVFGHVFDPAMIARCRATLEREADLTQYTTDIAIEDVEDIRARLGYEKMALFGVSYGTRMAQAYLRRHPERVSAVVIDGVVPFDPNLPLTYAGNAQQALNRVFAVCRADPACSETHPRLAEDFAAILRRLAAGPVQATVTPRGGTPEPVMMSVGDFGYAVRGILYGARGWTELPEMVRRAAATGDLSQFAQRYFEREVDMRALAHGLHLSVLCAEDVPFATEREVADATAGTFLGRYLYDEYRNACAAWPRATIRPDARTPVTASVPVLLVSGRFDPSTPPEFAERVARSLPLSRLVLSPTTGHGSASGCPRPAVLHLLTTGTFDRMPDVCGNPPGAGRGG